MQMGSEGSVVGNDDENKIHIHKTGLPNMYVILKELHHFWAKRQVIYVVQPVGPSPNSDPYALRNFGPGYPMSP